MATSFLQMIHRLGVHALAVVTARIDAGSRCNARAALAAARVERRLTPAPATAPPPQPQTSPLARAGAS